MLGLAATLLAACLAPRVVPLPFAEAEPVLRRYGQTLPAELRGTGAAGFAAWLSHRDAEVRQRLVRGDEDSLVNLLLFGTTFTARPRATAAHLARLDAQDTASLFAGRIDDLIAGLAAPGTNSRLRTMRGLVERLGHQPATREGRGRLAVYLLDSLRRVLREAESHARALAAARALGDPSATFAERSRLYADRGLSVDTSLPPNFAVEQALAGARDEGTLAPGSVARVAVIGPGLDFADKQEGHDFYPEQTLQPFALLDSLRRLGLAKTAGVELTVLDISPRVLAHVEQTARSGQAYALQLPRDPAWRPDLVAYWRAFGDRIGGPVRAVQVPPALRGLEMRAVEVRRDVLAAMRGVELNAVAGRLDLPAGQRFDLVVATNVLVYYGEIEQSLALLNVAAMLRPGGLLLSNNSLPLGEGVPMEAGGYRTVVYSERADDGDHVVWYRLTKKSGN
jgi:SAM-dependent methyltransferase